MSSIKAIAAKVGIAPALVRDVLKEVPGTKVGREVADRIFAAARQLKYDLNEFCSDYLAPKTPTKVESP